MPPDCPALASPLHLPKSRPNLQIPPLHHFRDPILPISHSHLVSNNNRVLSTHQPHSNPFAWRISFELTALRGKCYRWPHFTDEEIKSLVSCPRSLRRPFKPGHSCTTACASSHCAPHPCGHLYVFVLLQTDYKLPEERSTPWTSPDTLHTAGAQQLFVRHRPGSRKERRGL